MLTASVNRIDGVIITHDHADHCHGIDDLRPLAQALNGPVPVHARQDVIDSLRRRFAYAFAGSSLYSAVVEPVAIVADMRFGDARIRFVDQPHGSITSLGLRVDEGARSLVYAIDFNHLNDEMGILYQGADVWVCDCLSRQPHPTHTHLDAALGWARELRIGQLYLTHLNNSMDYATLAAELPDWAAPAHDGMEIAL